MHVRIIRIKRFATNANSTIDAPTRCEPRCWLKSVLPGFLYRRRERLLRIIFVLHTSTENLSPHNDLRSQTSVIGDSGTLSSSLRSPRHSRHRKGRMAPAGCLLSVTAPLRSRFLRLRLPRTPATRLKHSRRCRRYFVQPEILEPGRSRPNFFALARPPAARPHKRPIPLILSGTSLSRDPSYRVSKPTKLARPLPIRS